MADVVTLNRSADDLVFSGTERRVLRLLHQRGTLSRTELADRLGLSTASISVAVRKLLDSGVVGEADGRATGPGRPVTPVSIRPEAWSVLAMEVVAGLLRIAR